MVVVVGGGGGGGGGGSVVVVVGGGGSVVVVVGGGGSVTVVVVSPGSASCITNAKRCTGIAHFDAAPRGGAALSIGGIVVVDDGSVGRACFFDAVFLCVVFVTPRVPSVGDGAAAEMNEVPSPFACRYTSASMPTTASMTATAVAKIRRRRCIGGTLRPRDAPWRGGRQTVVNWRGACAV